MMTYPIIVFLLFIDEQLLKFGTDAVGLHEFLYSRFGLRFLLLVMDDDIDRLQITGHRLFQVWNGQFR